jgi:hypothetical protein
MTALAERGEVADEDGPPLPGGLGAVGVLVWCLVAVLSAAIEVLLIPLHIGRYVLPITVVVAVIGNYLLPRFSHRMLASSWAVLLPIAAWVVAAIALGFTNTSRGSVIVPGGGSDEYVGLALFFGGTLAGAIGVIRETNRR